MFVVSLVGQYFTGLAEHNKEREEEGQSPVTTREYFRSGQFIQATFENWESEFLQMALFVVLTISLRQKGSSESKKCEGKEEVDREPSPKRKGAPWPVRKGGWILRIYKHSLTIALLALFVLSFMLHLYGSLKDENEHLSLKGLPPETITSYMGESRVWVVKVKKMQSVFFYVF
jgi:hypothetical protein